MRVVWRVIVAAAALFAIGSVTAFAYGTANVGRPGGMEAETFASLLLSALLVLVTVFYAWQSAIAAQEMKTARAPHVDVDVRLFGDKFVSYVRNVGAAPALEVRLKLRVEVGAYVQEEAWYRSLLPGEGQTLLFPYDGHDLLTKDRAIADGGRLIASGSFLDVRGSKWPVSKTLDLKARFDHSIEGEIRGVESRMASNVEGIRKALDRIERRLGT